MIACGGELEDLRTKRDAAFVKADQDAATALQKASAGMLAAGDVSGAAAVDAAASELRPGGSPPDAAKLPGGGRLVMENRDAQRKKIAKIYLEQLAALKTRLSQAGNLGEAVKVDAEIAKVTPVQDLGRARWGNLGIREWWGTRRMRGKAGPGRLAR